MLHYYSCKIRVAENGGELFYCEVERLLSQPQYWHCPSFGTGNVKRIGEYKKIQLTDTVTSLVFKGQQGFYQA